MVILQDLSDLKGFTAAQVIGAVMIVLIVAGLWLELAEGTVSNIFSSLRGPRQIISHNICPRCQKVQTKEINPNQP